MVFFYTATGNNNKWSAGKQFTQRIAYSTDLLKWEQTDGVRYAAYINKMAYAAQTYSNTEKLVYDGTMKNVRQQDTATEIQITHAQSEDILSARINQED